MSNIIYLNPPSHMHLEPTENPNDMEMLWVCNCGNQTFKLMADGDTSCAYCGSRDLAHGGTWHRVICNEDAPIVDAGEVSSDFITVVEKNHNL